MKALVKYGQKPDMLELRDVPKPTPLPGTVLLEVKAAGICGWDLEMWQQRMANPVTVPVIQGHEFCGIIAEVGPGVSGWRTGDRVTSETSAVVCGRCRWCRVGEYQLCPGRKGYGYGVDGAFTSFVRVRQEILHRLPDSVPFETAALTEPFCVAHRALTEGTASVAGGTVLVIGPGPIGLICLQFARLLGAAQTILAGIAPARARMELALSEKWADNLIYADKQNVAQPPPAGGAQDRAPVPQQTVVDAVLALTDGGGADLVVDAAGNTAALKTALACVRPLGQIVKVGWGPAPFNESLDDLLRKAVSLRGTFGHNFQNWEAVLALFRAGRLHPQPLISAVMPLSRWREAFELVEAQKACKIVLRPDS